jgi:hypothetical protein
MAGDDDARFFLLNFFDHTQASRFKLGHRNVHGHTLVIHGNFSTCISSLIAVAPKAAGTTEFLVGRICKVARNFLAFSKRRLLLAE